MSLLPPGTLVGAYEIVAAIGAGGMGQVYRARDSKLKRDGALKLLPPEFARDRDRLARFQREAEVLASLNHPNIAHIHGLEQSNGADALVMELVEGEDLARRLERGAIPIDEALPIARQIAEALEAAHEQGIIHRDLKPANVKLRPDGVVKVLDFGLAKALDPASGNGDQDSRLANSPTITSPGATVHGVVLGTAAYMSPEQARGKPVDKRTDVWAFGVVLYEMLTTRRPFHGETVSDSVAAILKTDPDWSALPADTPFLIRRLLRHCLNRDPRERLADMRDARIEINEALTDAPGAAPPAGARSKAPWVVAAASLIALAAGATAVGVGWIGRAPTATAETIRFSFLPPEKVRASFQPVLSPDGRQLAFIGADDTGVLALWIHTFANGASRKISGTERLVPMASAFWSPDSRSLGFFADSRLKRVDVSGGMPVAIADAVEGRGGTWNQHGDIVFSLVTGPLLRVDASGGTPSPITELSADVTAHRVPHFMADGEHFICLGFGAGQPRLLLGSLAGRNVTELRSVDALSGTAPPDLVLLTAGGQLIAQRIDLAAGRLQPETTVITDFVSPFYAGWASATRDVLAYRDNPATGGVALAWVDRRGTVNRLPLAPNNYGDPALSPDGRHLALAIRDETGQHIWVYDIDRGSLGKRTFESNNAFPIWSRDGRHLIFSRGSASGGPLMRVAADGSAAAVEVTLNPQQQGQKIATSLSPDGTLMAVQRRQDVVVTEADGTVRETLASGAFEREGRFAPKGLWLAYRSNETGRDEVYVQSYPPGNGRWQISTQGGAQPMWNADGRELFYKNGNRLMVVPVQLTPTFKPGVPRELFQIPLPERNPGDPSRFAVSPDGQRFLVTTTDATRPVEDSAVRVILNWRR